MIKSENCRAGSSDVRQLCKQGLFLPGNGHVVARLHVDEQFGIDAEGIAPKNRQTQKKLLFFDKKVLSFFGDSKIMIIFAPKLFIVKQ